MKTLNIELPNSMVLRLTETRSGDVDMALESRKPSKYNSGNTLPSLDLKALLPSNRRQLLADFFKP